MSPGLQRDLTSQKGGLDTAKHCVQDHADRQQETCCCCWDTSQVGDHSRSSSEQHCCHKYIRHQTKGNENAMRDHAISSFDNFEEGVSVWRSAFELDGEGCKEDDLYCCSGGIPEWARNAIVVGDARRLQQRRSPSPR